MLGREMRTARKIWIKDLFKKKKVLRMASISTSSWLPHYQKKLSLNNSISWLVSFASRRFMSRNQGFVVGLGSWWSILAFFPRIWEQVCRGLLWYGKSRWECCCKNTIGLKNRARQWNCSLRSSPCSAAIKQRKSFDLRYFFFSCDNVYRKPMHKWWIVWISW